MHDENYFNSLDRVSFILVKDREIIKVNKQFIDMTEYTYDELLNKNIEDVFRILRRVGPNVSIDNIDEQVDYFLFTKSLEVKFINIEIVKEKDEQIYILRENPDLQFNYRFSFLSQISSENVCGVAIYSIPDNTLLKANQMYLDFLEAPHNTPENTLGRSVGEIITGWENSSAEIIWNNVVKSGKSEHIKEFEFDKFSRGITYWDITFMPLYENGNVRYMLIYSHEVTERVLYRKQLEEKNRVIEQQKKLLELFVENMADGLLLLDKNNKLTMLNKAAEDLFYKPENIINCGDSFAHTKYYDQDGNELNINDMPGLRILKGEKVNEFIVIAKRPDKTMYHSIKGRPVYNVEGGIDYAILCIHDISEKIKYEQDILTQKEMLEAILDNMQETLFVFDKNDKYIIVNKKAREVFNETLNKIGDSAKFAEIYDVNGNRMPSECLPGYRIICGEIIKEMILNFKFDEQERYSMISGTPIFDKNKNFMYGIISGRNITEFIHNQQALQESNEKLLKAEQEKLEALENAMKMKDEFLSMISHELRTPLNVISTAIQAMNSICHEELSDKTKKYIGMIRQNTFRQLRLVNNLLDITRANAGSIKINKKNIDIVFLTKAIIDSVYSYASNKEITITFTSSFKKKIIAIDDEKYERILLNLLSNAIKFTPEGKFIVVNLCSIKGSICIEVKDNGIGIPPNKIDIIFERFGQVDSSLSRQAEGTGIGLSLVKKFVEALGGSISVKSKVGTGSTFSILLPDEKIVENCEEKEMINLLDNRLTESTNVEFSDIYL
jgi:PAS domain S-box-containing protein